MMYAPISLFVYNRPVQLAKTLLALSENVLASESDLHIFSDNGDDVTEVREMIKEVKGFKSVHIHLNAFHQGLRGSILTGVSLMLREHDNLIILEDDIITSPNFLTYMNVCLDRFKDDNNIGSITGYNVIDIPEGYHEPVYLSHRPGSWGWATWQDRWYSFRSRCPVSRSDKDGFNIGGDDLFRMLIRQRRGEIDSWAIDWAFHHYKKGMYCVYPCVSKVCNIGIGEGTNCNTSTDRYDVKIDTCKEIDIGDEDIQPSDEMIDAFRAFWRYSLYKKFKVFINDTFIRPVLRRLA